LFFFIIFFCWSIIKIPYMGSFVAYATIFHNIRQFYGISKWYQRLSGKGRIGSDRFLYLLCAWPLLIAHFRSDIQWNSFYSQQDLLIFPNQILLEFTKNAYVIIFASWLIYERKSLKDPREHARICSMLLPALLYGASFVYGKTMSQILFPLVASHGAAYIGLVSLSLNRIQRPLRVSLLPTILIVVGTALAFGSTETILDGFSEHLNRSLYSLYIAITLTPLFCHFYFDAFLWRRDHPDANSIYF
jgi:hypothetical protein